MNYIPHTNSSLLIQVTNSLEHLIRNSIGKSPMSSLSLTRHVGKYFGKEQFTEELWNREDE